MKRGDLKNSLSYGLKVNPDERLGSIMILKVSDWLYTASREISAAKIMKEKEIFDLACYYAYLAADRAIRTIALVAEGWEAAERATFTDVVKLLKQRDFDMPSDIIYKFSSCSRHSFVVRHSGNYQDVKEIEAVEAIACSEEVVSFVRDFLAKNISKLGEGKTFYFPRDVGFSRVPWDIIYFVETAKRKLEDANINSKYGMSEEFFSYIYEAILNRLRAIVACDLQSGYSYKRPTLHVFNIVNFSKEQLPEYIMDVARKIEDIEDIIKQYGSDSRQIPNTSEMLEYAKQVVDYAISKVKSKYPDLLNGIIPKAEIGKMNLF